MPRQPPLTKSQSAPLGCYPKRVRCRERVMLGYLQTARQYLWAFVEIGFLTILAIMLIYLILGQASGVFVSGVADNVVKFATAIPSQSVIGIAIVLIVLIAKRKPNP
jgi:hypothetical protein